MYSVLNQDANHRKLLFKITVIPVFATVLIFLITLSAGVWVYEGRERLSQKRWMEVLLSGSQSLFTQEVIIYQELALQKRMEILMANYAKRYPNLEACLTLTVLQVEGQSAVFKRCTSENIADSTLKTLSPLELRVGETKVAVLSAAVQQPSLWSQIPWFIYVLLASALALGWIVTRLIVSRLYQSIFVPMLKKIAWEQEKNTLQTIALQVAHDIRSPVSALKIGISSLSTVDQDVKQIINGSLKRIQEIAEDLLARSRKGNDSNNTWSQEDLMPVISSVVSEVKARTNSRVELEVRADPKLSQNPAQTRIKPADLKRILANLIQNACEAGASKVRIEVESRQPQSEVILRVKDNGEGMDKNTLAKAGQAGFTSKADGTGLGLSSAIQVMEKSGGSVKIDSQKGLGTEISMVLPTLPAGNSPQTSIDKPSSAFH